jgi:MFS family permease
MNTQNYVKSLFKDYEESPGLAEFMEELQSNLEARIASLRIKGMDEKTAFEKATAELGDISALADDISRKKRQEVFEEQYMDIRHYMKKSRVAAYIVCGITLLFGVLTALIAYFGTHADQAAMSYLRGLGETQADLTALFGVLLVFLSASIAGFTYLGVTQETSSLYPVKTKRALLYALGTLLIVFGILLFPLVYFAAGAKDGLVGALASLLPFTLSGIGLLAFLVLTETERRKPWILAHLTEETKKYRELWGDPAAAARFGTLSGAIWIFAIGIFLVLGFALSFKFSWLVFVFAVAFELLVQSFLFKPDGNAPKTPPAGAERP